MRRRPIDIIIPVYRNGKLFAALLDSLRNCRDELDRLNARLIIGNDSPEDSETAAVIASAEADRSFAEVAIIRNDERRGFVQTVNKALVLSIASRRDVVLLNSDTVVFPGALEALADVPYRDPMIGFVSPRSNNAAIFSLPQQPALSRSDPQQAYTAFRALSPRLPEYHYMPTAIGFCMFIKFEVLQLFGVFDEIFGFGCQEENDLVMRANQGGYVAAAANRAFVSHVGGASIAAANLPRAEIDRHNAAVIETRYPAFFQAVGGYYAGSRYRAECLQGGLLPDESGRAAVVFDGHLPEWAELVSAAAAAWSGDFEVCAVGAARLRDSGLSEVAPTKVSSAAVHFGAPEDWETVLRVSRLAPVNVFVMHDTTAVDCVSSNIAGVAEIWSFVFEHADAIVYTSEFSQAQFSRRFQRGPDLVETVLPSDCVDSDGSLPLVPGLGWRAAATLRGVVETAVRTQSVDSRLLRRLTTLARIEQCIAAERRIREATSEARSSTERATRIESQLQRTVEEASESQKRAATAERAIEDFRATVEGLRALTTESRRRIAELESSLSWRITAPLRAAGRFLLIDAPRRRSIRRAK